MSSMSVGLWLRERRKDLGLTIEQFAQLCGLSYVTVSNIERDKIDIGIYATKRIAQGLGIEYMELRNEMKKIKGAL